MGTTIDQPIHRERTVAREPAPDLARIYIAFVNAYMVGTPDGPWVLVDTGLPRSAALIRRRAAARFGDRPPEAIVLTHGHFDHAGNARELADRWNVPIYAHAAELPFLTGRSDYPPADPTVGGALGLMSRAFPTDGTDLGERVRALPHDGRVPGLPDWRWLHTPGHTAGHVSLHRERDGLLLAGDALATVDQDSPLSMLNLASEFSVPPAPLTTDWPAARRSVERLAELRPYTVAAGHGAPVHGSHVADDLAEFARRFTPPSRGRYHDRPAVIDARGVVDVPPPVRDPLPRQLLTMGLIAGGAYLALRQSRSRMRATSASKRGWPRMGSMIGFTRR